LTRENYRDTKNTLGVSFDPGKRAATLKHRGLDFADAGLVFAGRTVTIPDIRRDYGEDRFITAGHLSGRCAVLVWTPRDGARRMVSMRLAHAEEEASWFR
jgi:uncharacterized DUF497 family protein